MTFGEGGVWSINTTSSGAYFRSHGFSDQEPKCHECGEVLYLPKTKLQDALVALYKLGGPDALEPSCFREPEVRAAISVRQMKELAFDVSAVARQVLKAAKKLPRK